MLRIFFLSLVLVGIVYFLPFATGEKDINQLNELKEISIPVISEFKIEQIIDIKSNEKISVLIDGSLKSIEIDEYLVGVLCAEMPASFETQALKAQAVAGRTYIYYKQYLKDTGNDDGRHPDAIVCNDHTHCKAYLDIYNENPWGDKYDLYLSKMENAVLDTTKEYITYEDTPIAAVFHSTSSQSTENAKDVWGYDVPYLQSVESLGSSQSPNYEKEIKVSIDDFKKIFLSKYSNASLDGLPTSWFKQSTRSDTGGIITVYVGDELVSGQDIRTLFSLNSTNFTVSFDDEYVIFNTTGYGHGVGLSQYGANALAKDGLDYKEILTWYYTGTQIQTKD